MATTKKPPRPQDEIRAALTGILDDLRAGGRDLYRDVKTLVRSARRDTAKLGKALYGDVERLAMAAPRLPEPPPRRVAPPRPQVPRRRAAARTTKAAV
jgi:hypothetical protein